MILSLLIITIAYYWLLRETDFLRCNLTGDNSIAVQCNEHRKHYPRIEPCKVKTCSYPVPEPIKLLAEFCEATQFQNKVVTEKWKHLNPDNCINWQMKPAYQQMTICGHALTLLASSSKLYDTMAEFQKIADGKTRTESFTKLRQTKEPMTCKMIYNPDSGNDEPHYESNCLFPIDWLKAHYQDVIPEPTIDLVVNGKETHFNGNFRTGCVHEFMVVNAELWERPRIKGKKIKVEVN